jgi:hypothetical protein
MVLIPVLLLLFSFSASAVEEVEVRLLKVFSNKREFVVQKSDYLSNDKEIFFRTKDMTLPKKGKLKVCKDKSCLGELEAGIFELNPADIKSYQVSTEKVSTGEKSLYLGFGSPLGAALRAGIRTNNRESFDYGLLLGLIDSTAGSSSVKGNAVSLIILKEMYKTGSWKFNFAGELGWAISTLQFKNDTNKEKIKESVYMSSVALDTQYAFESLSLGLKLGIAKSGFKDKYQLDSGEFSNPYGQMLMFLELGLHYPF